MVRPFTFVHAADLHVGSPFEGFRAQTDQGTLVEAVVNSTLQALTNLVNVCIDQDAAFLTLAGDVFDAPEVPIPMQTAFRQAMERLQEAGIEVFLAHGNHDPLDRAPMSLRLPRNVHVFPSSGIESKTVTRNGTEVARVSGISPRERETRKLLATFAKTVEPTELFQVAVLHCNVGGDTRHDDYVPCRLADLTALPVDYWALGHVHERAILHEAPWVVYPGNPQGRSVRETGPRGCYVVHVAGDRTATPTFRPLDAVRWFEHDVALPQVHAWDEILDEVETTLDTVAGQCPTPWGLLRLHLRARINPASDVGRRLKSPTARDELLETIRPLGLARTPGLWVESVRLHCPPTHDCDALRARSDLMGTVLALAEAWSADPETLQTVADDALGDLFHSTRIRGLLEAPSPADLHDLLREARDTCLDLLTEDAT